jgi:hypothetical protein
LILNLNLTNEAIATTNLQLLSPKLGECTGKQPTIPQ